MFLNTCIYSSSKYIEKKNTQIKRRHEILTTAQLNISANQLLRAVVFAVWKINKVLCRWSMPACSPVPVMISIHKHAVCYPPPGSCLCAYEITIMHLPIPRINISPLLKFASMRHILAPYDLSIPSGITCNLFSFYIHCSTLMGI